jgi:ubiquinone/menaquinone biosynthesis C-methylase UbiE
MKHNKTIAEQFNNGADHFDMWSVTRNERMLQGMAAFCGLSRDDDLLDVACGTGAFTRYAAPIVHSAIGVDISKGMLEIARCHVEETGLTNISFLHRDVERLDFNCNRFSVVVSRSAFHHMSNYRAVFAEMIRCCRTEGTVCIQDVVAYDDPKVDRFFERMEILIDRSHHRTYSKREIFTLYKANGLKLEVLFPSESLLDFEDYVNHLPQTEATRNEINRLLAEGLADRDIAGAFDNIGGRLLWKRNVCTIKGRKTHTPSNQ